MEIGDNLQVKILKRTSGVSNVDLDIFIRLQLIVYRRNIGQKTMGKITAKIFDRERLEFCCVDLYITQVDVVIAYFVTTRLWIQHNLIINHRQFHQKAPTNFLARCACFM